ncbi:MAG: hypothetical protein ACREL7_09090 [Longimicrobiales bacterium]
MRRGRIFRTTGLILLALATVAGVGALVVRDQISRHRRDLFSTSARQRLAALGYIGGLNGSVELVQLLRDYASWEPRALLRRRAQQILARMERQLQRNGPRTGIAG